MYTEYECTEAVRLLLGCTVEYCHGKVGADIPTPTPEMPAVEPVVRFYPSSAHRVNIHPNSP